jgi:hypothetical protein
MLVGTRLEQRDPDTPARMGKRAQAAHWSGADNG